MATKSVYFYELGKHFPSITDAARETGANASSISACCKGKQERAGGYRWAYFEVNGKSVANRAPAKGKVRKVKCIETGIIYSSAKEASNILHIDISSICKVCNGKRKTAGGLTWQRL